MPKGIFARPSSEQRFWSKIDLDFESGCWNWTAYKTEGYGHLLIRTYNVKAHRFSYELLKGKIPEGLQIDHLCRNRACVNPSHLEIVTQRENILRGKGPSAIHSKKTHCIRGHPLSGDNLIALSNGNRNCLTCKRLVDHIYYERRKFAK